jgi:4-diphosphocytidyl-2-C-methyl-D-erythritol kinase
VNRASATAKINLALVVGPKRADGRHEVVTVLQRIGLVDRLELQPSTALRVDGFAPDTLVRHALELVAAAAGTPPSWRVRIEKRIPVAAGLGGGSSDAAAALALASGTLAEPLPRERLHSLATQLGSDVPFFLTDGPQLATGTGTDLRPLELPQDFWIVLVLPRDAQKRSTANVYDAFDRGAGFAQRRDELLAALDAVRRSADLAALPPNDLASSPLAGQLLTAGAFRADVSGAGPAVYGLFVHERDARSAAHGLRSSGRVWITAPAWYG